jgi:hypothetical protein
MIHDLSIQLTSLPLLPEAKHWSSIASYHQTCQETKCLVTGFPMQQFEFSRAVLQNGYPFGTCISSN